MARVNDIANALVKVCELSPSRAGAVAGEIEKALTRYHISTPRQVCAFLAQTAHETGNFARFSENLNYSAKRLCEVWPSRFPTLAAAARYAHNPKALACKVYAGRMGNGDIASGDGWTFKGTGAIQLTGRNNYERWAKAIGKTLDEAVEYIQSLEGAFNAAGWFWQANGCNALAQLEDLKALTKRINGGYTGLEHRTKLYKMFQDELGEKL